MKYQHQVELVVDALPLVFKDTRIAMKGGTALNLFYHDMPRLSVDIDITYLPIEDRQTSFTNIHQILSDMKTSLKMALQCEVLASQKLDGKRETKLVVDRNDIQIKIEPNFTIRGAVFPAEHKDLSPKCAKEFGREISVRCLNRADLYGGKICAALDRQHPRDLFDVKIFFETGGFDRNVVDAFLYYLLSHNRPFHEVLAPNLKELREAFDSDFSGMTEKKIEIEELARVREDLVRKIRTELTDRDKNFLMAIAKGDPDWSLYSHPRIKDYPSIKWRLVNLSRMTKDKRLTQLKDLENVLS